MKKIISLILCLTIIIGLNSASIKAAEEPSFSLSGEEVYTPSENYYTLTISLKNNPGIVSIRFNLSWDKDVFELVYLEKQPILEELEATFPPNWVEEREANGKRLGKGEVKEGAQNPATFYYKNLLSKENYLDNGNLLKVFFKLKPNVAEGTTASFTVNLITEKSSLQYDLTKIAWLPASKTVTIAPCSHTFAEATCTAPPTCTKCGKTTGEALGHLYTSSDIKPTCTEGGYTLYTCSRCKGTYQEPATPATGHSPEEKTVPPTCTEEGFFGTVCTVCGTVLSEKTNIVPATGHTLGEKINVAPTCITEGYTVSVCSVCGAEMGEKSNFVPVTNHTFGEMKTVPPTCVNEGYTVSICAICEQEYGDKTDIIPAMGHTYEKDIHVAPTCTEEGYTTAICSVCGQESGERTEVIPSLGGHNFENGYCTVCGEKEVPDPYPTDLIILVTVCCIAAAAIIGVIIVVVKVNGRKKKSEIKEEEIKEEGE